MKNLGVSPGAGKVMPAALVELAGEDEDDEEPPRLEESGARAEGDAG
jgi:hypothetical protein